MSRPAALDSPARAALRATVAATGVTVIDLTDYLRTPPLCPAIIGDTLGAGRARLTSGSFDQRAVRSKSSPTATNARLARYTHVVVPWQGAEPKKFLETLLSSTEHFSAKLA